VTQLQCPNCGGHNTTCPGGNFTGCGCLLFFGIGGFLILAALVSGAPTYQGPPLPLGLSFLLAYACMRSTNIDKALLLLS
jgi:hypothetical protein